MTSARWRSSTRLPTPPLPVYINNAVVCKRRHLCHVVCRRRFDQRMPTTLTYELIGSGLLDSSNSRQGRTFSMKMVRLLCKSQHPSKIGELLESYIAQSDVVPRGSYKIRQPGSVPREVREVLTQALKEGQTWSCWAHGLHTWLFTCNMSRPLSRERGAPVLQVSIYGDDGGLRDRGSWIPDQQGKWCRDSC